MGTFSLLVNLASEVVRDGGKFGHRFRRHLRPALIGYRIRQRIVRISVLDAHDAYARELSRGDFGLRVVELAQLEFHVRLTGSHPHVADQNVVDYDLIGAAHREFVRAAG